MTVLKGADEGRAAYTDSEVLERFANQIFYVRALPKTGRTHQIVCIWAKSGIRFWPMRCMAREAALPEYGLARQAAARASLDVHASRPPGKACSFELNCPMI